MEERKSQEKQSYKEIVEFFENSGWEVKDVHNNPEYYGKDIDLLVSAENDYSIEIKFDDYLDKTTNNFFFEIISNEKLSTPGCFLKSQADVLLYYAKESHIGYFFPMKSLQNRFFDIRGDFYNMKEIDDNFILKSTHTKGEDGKYHHTTIGRLIDKKLLFIGCDKKGINYLENNIIEDGIAPRGLDILFESGKVKEISDMEIEDILLDEELFNSLKTMTDKQAKAISKLKSPDLHLESLEEITNIQTKYISNFGGEAIYLSSLKHINDKQAEYFKDSNLRGIDLTGLESITDKQAEILSENTAIEINKKILTKKQINILSENIKNWDNGYKIPFPSTNEEFDQFLKELNKYYHINLNKLEYLSDEEFKYLSKYEGTIELNGIESFSDKQLSSLGNCRGGVYLNGLKELTNKQFEIISNFKCSLLYLNGLSDITNKQIEILAGYKGHTISLNGIKSLSDEQMELLQEKFKGKSLYLEGLTTITDKQVEMFCNGNNFGLGNITTLTDNQLELLCKSGRNLDLDGIKVFSNEQLKILSNCKGIVLSLNGINTLNDEQAKYLAKYKGNSLYLNGLKSITDSQCHIFETYRLVHTSLYLNGLESITVSQINLLKNALWKFLGLNGLVRITDEEAEALCGLSCEYVELNNVKLTYKQALILESCENTREGINRGYGFSIEPKGVSDLEY